MVSSNAYSRLLEPPQKSFFLFGLRGSGKSTWARDHFREAPRIDLLDERLYQDLILHPEFFTTPLESLPPGAWVVVDEIQRIPGLLNYVHKYIEERRLKFVLLGSSSRKLRQAGVNLLGGRALLRHMYPFVPAELGPHFDLERVLRYGSIPIIWNEPQPEQSLEAYVQLFMRDEIRAEALVRNFPAFARFFPTVALMHGQTINVSSLSRDSGVARSTLIDHLNVLEDTHMIYQLPAFETRLRVRERKQPKLYWVDPGLVRAAAGRRGAVGHEERGPLFEGWIASLLRVYGEYRGLFDSMAYWSPHGSRVEVDFVLRRGQDLLAIEVKSAERVQPEHLKGLRAMGELPEVRRRILIYNGRYALKTEDGIEEWPVATFLAALAGDSLWP